MKASVLLVLLFFSGTLWLQAQPTGLEQQPIDSALSWLERTMGDDPEGFHEVGLQTLDRALELQNDSLIAEAHDRLADWHCFNIPFHQDSCLYHSEKKLEYLLRTGDQVQIADAYLTLTIDYLNNNRLEDTQKAAFKAIDIFEKLGDHEGLGRGYRILSSVFMVQEQPGSAIDYARKAISILKENPENEILVAITQLNLITGYYQLEQYKRSVAVADTCLAMVLEKYPEEFGILGRAYSFRGDAHLELAHYDRALSDFTTAWKTVEAVVGPERSASYRTDIGKVLMVQNRHAEAIPHLEAGLAEMEGTGTKLIWEPYLQLSQAYEQTGNYQQALEYRDKYIAAYGSMLEGKVSNLESEAAIKYETVKKDEAIAQQSLRLKQQAKIQWLSWGIALSVSILLGTLFFFFQRNRKTMALIQSKNAENELLLKEIHHRVKNNLEMVSSLLKLQSVKTKDAEAKGVMQASQARVQSMGIIHQKLYQGEKLATIDMLDYFQELSDHILDAFGARETVQVHYQVGNVELDVDTAVPIGLIVNELLTNSLKYAFPEATKGEITIRLQEEDENHLRLEVADNGIGIKEEETPKGTGFGSQLVALLTQQLQGTLQTDFSRGSRFSFQLERAILS